MKRHSIDTHNDCWVDLFLLDIEPGRVDTQLLFPVLSPHEQTLADRYIHEIDRNLFISRRAHLRWLLAAYLQIQPAEVEYCANVYGKLYLSSNDLWFNLSMSRNRVVYAFTREGEIGVDIEQEREIPEGLDLAQRWFSEGENAQLAALPHEKFQAAFFHVWTQKEAYIKARGEGLSIPLTSFCVSVDPHSPGGLLPADREWKLLTMIPDPGWRLAVCLHTRHSPRLELAREFK